MDLTGKCKEDFYNFITKGFMECDFARDMIVNDLKFKSKTELNALIIEFFDINGIYISINYVSFYDEMRSDKGFESYVTNKSLSTKFRALKTRQEATQQAIKKANEIYNNL